MKQSLLIWIPSVSSRPCHIDYSFEYIFLLTCAALIADKPILSSSLLLHEIYALCHYFGKENASYDIFGAHENSILSAMLSYAKIKLFLVLGAPLRALSLWISKQSTAMTNIIKYHNCDTHCTVWPLTAIAVQAKKYLKHFFSAPRKCKIGTLLFKRYSTSTSAYMRHVVECS